MDDVHSDPRILLFALCDQAITDKATGKVSLIGMFDRLNALQFPATFSFALALRVTGLKAGSSVSLNLLPQSGGEMRIAEKRFDTPQQIEQIMLNVGGAGFDQPGDYWFVVRIDEKELGRLPFQAALANVPGSQIAQA
jgi:hypothetical protein